MKTKTRSKPTVNHSDAAPRKSAVEEKLQALMQRARSKPSFVLGALIILYCIARLVFSA